jgi:hypothetical protein
MKSKEYSRVVADESDGTRIRASEKTNQEQEKSAIV